MHLILKPELNLYEISTDFSNGLVILQNLLDLIEKNLNKAIFTKIRNIVANELNTLIHDSIFERQTFLISGAYQFANDMKALFRLFKKYSTVPENLFKDIKEDCIIFTMNTEILSELQAKMIQSNDEEVPTILHNYNIYKLTKFSVEKLIMQRSEISKLQTKD